MNTNRIEVINVVYEIHRVTKAAKLSLISSNNGYLYRILINKICK